MVANFPTGTYRVQVRPDFDLDATAGLAGYLYDLGASHLYSAPLLAATPGSPHGYDVVDPTRVNPELGGPEALRRLATALRQQGLGLVVDIVPNHMGLFQPAANPAWWDVLTHGRESRYADWFDIDWAAGPLVVPVLGDEADLARLTVEDGELRYYEHRFPIAPGTGGGTPQQVHDRQHYRLVDWRLGNRLLNYRRFFAVTELAGVRVEDPAVFEATHAEVLRWVADGDVQGIRVDHPDGLRDPGGYLTALRERAPDAWLVVEKILERGEPLPPHWPVDGTTGYDALGEVCGLFVDPDGAPPVEGPGWDEEAHEQKLDVTRRLFPAELRRLDALAPSVGAGASAGSNATTETLGELAANFHVYRTYLPYGRADFDAAVAETKRRRPDLAGTLDALTPRLTDPADELCARFQQLTGAVMAKGVEDTAMYRWNRFIALNEVGGDPSRFGVPPQEFHEAAARRLEQWPAGMTTLSTHDTKRGEDVRARLAVLSEAPDLLMPLYGRAGIPDFSFEALFWQTVVGAWPIGADRLLAYLTKAAREANRSTSWDAPDEAFEATFAAAVRRLDDDAALRADVDAIVRRIRPFGWSNALGQKLVQLTMPGIPDVYQGTELWEDSLVDPDNRRPVDFAERRDLLAALDAAAAPPPVDDSGVAKLLVVSRALRLRRDRPELFQRYHPVPVTGDAAGHAVAFDRGGALTVATRLPLRLAAAGGWDAEDLKLPGGAWTDVLTGRAVDSTRVGDILATYPVALLVRE
ncbi:malto-oligosyltrehalose synthase [Dactylosporangium aurantiacum]|uniref:Malto-oligosyltrehalose synthase n=1 Tax=Dactylosporangium aurantiacum TaxID=35754 RepID=A0A9Q9ICS4_9ACTN|nr:malto-oligosyltrehalose synthase [Dactylosporangium aurantiacum]MDG6103439.1 malto-oligosyltrehalose synthase [Dactylosporangium aurantiacum]UWZ52053.1 malto-oligosyltrehalose synthase [Dactylosporangium aurantiacum]